MGASGVAGGVLMAIDPKLDCYAILGVPPDAEDGVIRAAFEALVERYHPDRFNGPRAEADQKMSDLNSAYEVLADPAQRRRYDLRRRIYARTAPLDAKDSKESVLGPRPAFPRMRAVSPAADLEVLALCADEGANGRREETGHHLELGAYVELAGESSAPAAGAPYQPRAVGLRVEGPRG